MKNLKAHHHLALVSMVIFGVVSIWAWGTVVFASSGSTTVNLYLGPPDNCPNIPGYQTSTPKGMSIDGDGNCYTPPQNGSEPSQDMCANVTGTQALIPSGMRRTENGICFTPSTTNPATNRPEDSRPDSPWVAPTSPRNGTSTGDIKNVPEFLEPYVRPFVDAIPSTVKDALRSVPPVMAWVFPYFTYSILAAAGAVLSWQAVGQAMVARRLTTLIRRERDIAAEKDSFIRLMSHYFRTPLLHMEQSVGTSIKPASVAIERLGSDIATVMIGAEDSATLNTVEPPARTRLIHVGLLASSLFWLPVATALVLTWLSNFLLGVVGNVELGTLNLALQAGVFVASSLFFYSTIRSKYIKTKHRLFREQELEHIEALDHARNEFITTSSLLLTKRLTALSSVKKQLKGTAKEVAFTKSYDHLAHLIERFKFLTQVEIGTVGATERFNLHTSVEGLLKQYEPTLQAKQLIVINHTSATSIKQRRTLFEFVLASLLDDVIDVSSPGSTITINSSAREHDLSVQVTNLNHSVSKNTTHAVETHFEYDGLGLSLFLDRIIMDYVGRTATR